MINDLSANTVRILLGRDCILSCSKAQLFVNENAQYPRE